MSNAKLKTCKLPQKVVSYALLKIYHAFYYNIMNEYTRNYKLALWLKNAGKSAGEASRLLAELAYTTEVMIHQWKAGRRKMSADSAGRVEAAMTKFSAINIHAPQPLTRGDLCEACSECPYYIHVAGRSDV